MLGPRLGSNQEEWLDLRDLQTAVDMEDRDRATGYIHKLRQALLESYLWEADSQEELDAVMKLGVAHRLWNDVLNEGYRIAVDQLAFNEDCDAEQYRESLTARDEQGR